MPDEDNIFEIDEVKDGRRLRWYAATLKGDPKLHRIRQFGAKLIAQKRMSIRQVLAAFPDRTTSTGEADFSGSSDDTQQFEKTAEDAEEL